MLLFFFTQIIFSQTLTQDLNFGYFEYLLGETRYDTIQLNIEAGVALMMVEWDTAQLTIEIPSKGIVFKLTKELGLSLFTFSNPATVKITNIKSFIASINDLIQEIKNDQTISDITIDFDINTNEGLDLYDDFENEFGIGIDINI